jgi:NAD(P)-dependent dehydrogenase (short-subunit alcohol dehydrogenase family)
MNRVVLITGAGSGLGLSLTEYFLEAGDVVFGATRTKRHWKSAMTRVDHHRRFFLYQVDLSSEPAVRRFVGAVKKKARRIDVLINSAGYGGRLVRTEKQTLREFQRHLSSNLLTTFLMCKHTLATLPLSPKGWIINIASYAGKRAVPLMGPYSASKFGVVALSQVIAKENLDEEFKCITLCPGGMNTEMRKLLFGKADAERQQSPDFVAEKILEIIDGKIPVDSGSDVVIRHRQVKVNPLPPP